MHYWIDLVFGKRQQSVEDKNVYFSFATEAYYEKTPKEKYMPGAPTSVTNFFQLPKQLFLNYHKTMDMRDQSENTEENSGALTVPNAEGVEEVNKEEIKINHDEDITSSQPYRKSDNPFRNMSVLTGNLKNSESTFHLVWKINKSMPLISVQRYKKDKIPPTALDRVIFEVEYPSDSVFPSNYISQFTLQGKDYIVISRLLTSKFAVISCDNEPIKCHYYGLDCLTNIITSIHCTADNQTIIAGYQTGSIGIWSIKENPSSKYWQSKKNDDNSVSLIVYIKIAWWTGIRKAI